MSWLDTIKRLCGAKRQAANQAPNIQDLQADIPWIAANDNPWGVAVLDVRPVTLSMMSTSKDPHCATNALSYGQDDGTGFIDQSPPLNRCLPADLCYRRQGLLADGALFVPRQMEHKWAIYHHAGKLICVRGWLRQVQVVAQLCQEADTIRVHQITGAFGGDDEQPRLTIRTLDYLLRSHALGMVFPAPLPEVMADSPAHAAFWCMSMFGNQAHFATPHDFSAQMPETPLRSYSLLHLAVAKGDEAAVQRALKQGIPINLLDRDGMAALHWALTVPMLDLLLAHGANIDTPSEEGATALMNAVQGNRAESVEFLLNHGANPNARDERGFTALHRAAEMGHASLVSLLISHGADINMEAQGHSPLSLAEKQGQKDIARLLR